MNCPKCSYLIDENTLVCPNCKKVLKLVCPICKTINKTNTCHKCGYVIVSKCYKCGKINQTINGKCKKCGFPTTTSVLLNESNINEFATLSIEFPNLKDFENTLSSSKTFHKFKARLNKLLYDFATSVGVRRQYVKDAVILRFNKDLTFTSSCRAAIKAAIAIANTITQLNSKLSAREQQPLKCNMAVLKRSVKSSENSYESGIQINMLYQNTAELKLLNNIQIITDQDIFNVLNLEYELSSLNALYIKKQMVMFFELNTKKYIEIPEAVQEDVEEEFTLPESILKADESQIDTDDELYDMDSIDFDEIKCNFIRTESANLYPNIKEIINKRANNIITIKSDERLAPKTDILIDKLKTSRKFQTIYRVTCYEDMKYKPYGFFIDLISGIYGYNIASINYIQNNFSAFNEVDPSGFIKDLMNMNPREFPHPEDVRYSLFDIFGTIIFSMEYTALYVENAEFMDDTSLEVLQMLIAKFKDFNITLIIQSNKDFSLHKNSHFLLGQPYYNEISLKKTKFSQFINGKMEPFMNILNTFYFQKIGQNTKGSELYLENILKYLIETGVLVKKGKQFIDTKQESVIIPNSLEELVERRFKNLKKDSETFKIFVSILFCGPRVDFLTLHALDIPTSIECVKKLETMGLLMLQNPSVYISNYNLYYKTMLKALSREEKQYFANLLLNKIFANKKVHLPIRAQLFNILELQKLEFLEWEALSNISTSMGDFSAFLNCSIKFLNLLDNNIDESSEKTIEEYKLDVYENISNLLYKYTPEKIYNITQVILDNLENTTDDKKTINLCNKMLQGCLISGNYSHALQLAHKILSRMPNQSTNPNNKNFNIGYLLVSIVKVEVLFNIGNFADCIELGESIINSLDKSITSAITPESLTASQFKELIFDTMGFVLFSKIIQLDKNIEEIVYKWNEQFEELPRSFELFKDLLKTTHGIKTEPDETLIGNDKYSKILFYIVKAFNRKDGNYNAFAGDIYQAKLSAKQNNLHQIELICDLLIGYSYFALGKTQKSNSIYQNVLKTSTSNGLNAVTFVAWYLIAILEFVSGDLAVAGGIISNAVLQLEKDEKASDYILMLYKILQHKFLKVTGEDEQAELCIKHARYIISQNNIKFHIDGDENPEIVDNTKELEE